MSALFAALTQLCCRSAKRIAYENKRVAVILGASCDSCDAHAWVEDLAVLVLFKPCRIVVSERCCSLASHTARRACDGLLPAFAGVLRPSDFRARGGLKIFILTPGRHTSFHRNNEDSGPRHTPPHVKLLTFRSVVVSEN